MVTSRVLALAVVALIAPAIAHADKLADARQAIDEVRYDDARGLLVEALDVGGNSTTAVRQIYELSASTAIVLGQRDLGEQYYRRWLAIDPGAKLPDGSSPKLVEAFVAAQSYMAAHGRLIVKAARTSASVVDVVVESDPLSMAASAARTPFGADRHARVDVVPGPMTIAILDEHGNHLVDLEVAAAMVESRPDRPVISPRAEQRPFSRRWTTWAVPSGAFLVAGAILGALAITEQDELDTALSNSGEHFFSEIDDQHRKIKLHATIAIGLASTSALLAIPAVVFYVRGRKPWSLTPSIVPNGVSVTGRF